ncbi:MAG: ABC transporter ATP-binding protein [Deltaproteobacteria bacterium]|nr:ABC transporter ATP-binding protein [Deltaproteobacteria bacterium]
MQHSYGFFEEDQLANFGDAALWRRIGRYVRPQRLRVTTAVLLSMAVIVTNLALPYLIRLAIDNFISAPQLTVDQRIAGLGNLAAIFIVLVIIGFAANFFQVTVLELSGQHIMHHLRQELFRHLLSLDLTFFNNNPAGKLVTRLTNDIQNMHEMFTSVAITIFNDVLQLIGILAILYWMNWRLAGLMTLLLPLVLLHSVTFSRMARDAFRKIRTQLAVINSFLQETLGGMSLIQHFLQERHTEQKFRQQNRLYRQQTMAQIKIFGIFLPLLELISHIAIAMIIWFGGKEVLAGRITIGEMAAFLSYMRLFFKPMREISQKYSIIQSAMASAERIFQLLDRKSALTTAGRQKPAIRGDIQFREVNFSYNNQKKIIRQLNLRIKPGESLAIVGATGAGKTSIINLLVRLYEPNSGLISIDNIGLADFDLHWLRRQIGLVMQDIFLIPGTFRENLALGGEISARQEMMLLRRSQLSEIVQALPNGLDTVIGEGGYELSVGQKQLLALGRVMIRDPAILILDEATANIDSITEEMLERAITTTLSNRTSIVIAHRLSTIRHAQQIVVLEQGTITEQGSYDELLAAGGLFSRLVHLQQIS